MIEIHQGDQYGIAISIVMKDREHPGEKIVQTDSDISKLEIILGGVRKEYPGDVIYNSDSKKFVFPLTQNESFSMAPKVYEMLCRPHFINDTILGWKTIENVKVIEMNGAQTI